MSPVPTATWSLRAPIAKPTDHQRARVRGAVVRLIVLHCDASPNEGGTISWLASPQAQGAYHVLIGRDGTCYRFVQDEACAYHAGRAEWHGDPNVNDLSLGLCFSNRNDGTEPLTAVQQEVGRLWVAYWAGKYATIEDVTTHATCARPVGRKVDPDGLVPLPTGGTGPAVPGFDVTPYRALVRVP